jgi:uncharacterized protein YlxP (DUF503 family)
MEKKEKSIWVFKDRAEMEKKLNEILHLIETNPEWKRRYEILGNL